VVVVVVVVVTVAAAALGCWFVDGDDLTAALHDLHRLRNDLYCVEWDVKP